MKIFLYWSLAKKPGYTTIFKIIVQSYRTFLVKISIYQLQYLSRNALVSLEHILTEFCYFNIRMQKWVTPSKSSSKCQSIKEMARWRGERQERSLLVIPHPVPAPALLPVSVGWRLCARQLLSPSAPLLARRVHCVDIVDRAVHGIKLVSHWQQFRNHPCLVICYWIQNTIKILSSKLFLEWILFSSATSLENGF